MRQPQDFQDGEGGVDGEVGLHQKMDAEALKAE